MKTIVQLVPLSYEVEEVPGGLRASWRNALDGTIIIEAPTQAEIEKIMPVAMDLWITWGTQNGHAMEFTSKNERILIR